MNLLYDLKFARHAYSEEISFFAPLDPLEIQQIHRACNEATDFPHPVDRFAAGWARHLFDKVVKLDQTIAALEAADKLVAALAIAGVRHAAIQKAADAYLEATGP